ncbi:hypothetical protein MSAN_00520800 [Mycena sanguinolenta]|uniref:Glycan binding protein Y3-like domain-containing protein n=1 Tax=Mycena sanguinolenta TaxID=230812 RepID=A0A8H6ZCF4_9AGAR|nr:hypothetical protein MSAN_00520800 [Mycena sanguinolenta]
MFQNLIPLLTVAVLATMANAEGCYNGGNTNAAPCYSQFSEDFCSDVIYGTRSECHVLDSKTHCDFSVTGPSGNPAYSDCVYAMSQLNYFCSETGGLKTVNGYQYKLDPNDGGSC